MRRRTVLFSSSLTAAALSAVGGFLLTSSPAQQGKADPPPAPVAGPNLPINHVVLFSSGVGYFQREGEVQGNARVDLSFPTPDINDLLKSMVLQDLGNGHISAVNYDSHDPIDRTLKSYAINLTNNPTYGQILNQARGEKVEVVLQQTQGAQPATLTGVIIGVERKKEAVEVEMVNLWCAEGMRCVKLGDVQRVRFLNPVMDGEVKKALETLALSHDTQKKTVSLNFTGEGRRSVKVGYVVENPIWKTSYRLVLDKKGKPFLQGWAMVENTQDEDWTNVRMGLISGRPISFQMDLYQPLYVPRPVVEPELFASLRPPTYNGAMQRSDDQDDAIRDGKGPGRKQVEEAIKKLSKDVRDQKIVRSKREEELITDLTKGVTPSAHATSLGDYFEYAIDHPVTLPRQKSAMLPIINQPVEGDKVSIYNENTHAKFPLLGLKFRNTTALHLMQGPITVFDNSAYAGDARIEDLQPKEERLISYAVDLGTEVEPIVNEGKDDVLKVRIIKGILHTTHLIRQSKTYKVKNRSEQDRVLLIEHPFQPQFKLVVPEKPTERARDVYRFEVKVAAGQSVKQEVVEERELLNLVNLSNANDDLMKVVLSQRVLSETVKKALQDAAALKNKAVLTRQEIEQNERRLNDIRKDQERIRENLKTVPPDSDAHKRYVKKFDVQETEIEQLMDSIKKLQDREFKERKDFETFLTQLSAE